MSEEKASRPRGHRGRFVSPVPSGQRRCEVCFRTDTTQWRISRQGGSLCNACGIRMTRMKSSSASSTPSSSSGAGKRAQVKAAAALAQQQRQRLRDATSPPESSSSAQLPRYQLPPLPSPTSSHYAHNASSTQPLLPSYSTIAGGAGIPPPNRSAPSNADSGRPPKKKWLKTVLN